MARSPPSHPDPLSSHVLDTTSGLPATGVTATLFVKRDVRDDTSWQKVATRQVTILLKHARSRIFGTQPV